MGFWKTIKSWFAGPNEAEAAREELERQSASPTSDANVSRNVTPPVAATENPYSQSPIAGFNEAQVRKRFFKLQRRGITPFFTPESIPSTTDEFTLLVDRSMVLGGYLSQEELDAIHRIGDEALKYKKRLEHARIVGKRSGETAVQAFRDEKARRGEERRAAAKERAAARRVEIEERRANDIIHLGFGVSGSLGDRRSHVENLSAAGLPVLSTPADVAQALSITIPQLRWLCFHDDAAQKTHYRRFTIPKRSGGERHLAAPLPHLARAQRWIFDNIVQKLEIEPVAHGFVSGRSTVTNAAPHVGQDVVINLDLSDFFPTIAFPRVRGLFESLGYSPAVATIFALICTESPRRSVSYDGTEYLVAIGARALPQGACTSPGLANRITRRLDRRLIGLCSKKGWTYTRYADDLTFSIGKGKRDQIPHLLGAVRRLVREEGFLVNPKKGRIQRSGGRQDVTGIVVNNKLGLPRTEVRRLRAILHGAKQNGLASQNREGRENFPAWLEGKLAYLAMVDPEKGRAMLAQFRCLTR